METILGTEQGEKNRTNLKDFFKTTDDLEWLAAISAQPGFKAKIWTEKKTADIGYLRQVKLSVDDAGYKSVALFFSKVPNGEFDQGFIFNNNPMTPREESLEYLQVLNVVEESGKIIKANLRVVNFLFEGEIFNKTVFYLDKNKVDE